MLTTGAVGSRAREWPSRPLRHVLACLCIAMIVSGDPASHVAARGNGSGADLSVDFGSGDFSGYQTVVFDIFNDGPEDAVDVVFQTTTPPNVDFLAVRIDFLATVPLRCTTPPSGQQGAIACVLGSIPANSTVSVRVDFGIELPPGTELAITASIAASNDMNSTNDTLDGIITIPFPPVVDTVEARQRAGEPFSIELTGEHLDIGIGTFGFVGIGCGCQPWHNAREESSTRIVLEGGKALKRLFPNPDYS